MEDRKDSDQRDCKAYKAEAAPRKITFDSLQQDMKEGLLMREVTPECYGRGTIILEKMRMDGLLPPVGVRMSADRVLVMALDGEELRINPLGEAFIFMFLADGTTNILTIPRWTNHF